MSQRATTNQSPPGEHLAGCIGPLVGGLSLAKILGFRSTAALAQAARRGKLPIKVFSLEGRRGLFALSQEVNSWLSTLAAKPKLVKGGDDKT